MNLPFSLTPSRAASVAWPEPRALTSVVFRLYPALTNPPFRMLWLGLLPATMSFQMGMVVRPYVAYALTGEASALGLVSVASGLPMLLLCLVGGVAADRLPRRSVLMWTQIVFLVSSVLPAVLLFTGHLEIWTLLLASLLQGAAMPFNMPARQAYIAQVAGRAHLANAVALNNAGANFGRLVGPAVAGVLLAVPEIGIGLAFSVMALMFLAALATLFRLPAGGPTQSTTSVARPGGLQQLKEGLSYTRSSPALLAMLAMGAAMAIFGQQYQTFMTLFSERVFSVGASGLGLLMAMSGVGALAGAVTIAGATRIGRPAALQVIVGVAFALVLIGFSLAPTFLVALPLLTLVGFFGAAFMGLNSTLIMSNAPSHLYGRIMSIYMLTFAAQPLGAVPLAWVADAAGAPASMVVAGSAVLAIVLGIGVFFAPYREIRWTASTPERAA
ncbi:MAG TPA: MFS transporter [Chloroflexota bacterium]|nr:MFS transporter [Chloroflexota bacterium]